jgi:hypothetical protein
VSAATIRPAPGSAEQAAFVEWLAGRHSERTGLTLQQARQHVAAVAISPRAPAREDAELESLWPRPRGPGKLGPRHNYLAPDRDAERRLEERKRRRRPKETASTSSA